MMTHDNRHKLAAPYWARPNLRTVTDPDGGGGNDDDDLDDDEDDEDDEGDDDPDAGKTEAELRAEVKAARLALEEAERREVRRKKEAARLRKRNAAAKPADDDKPDADAIKAEAQAAADERVAKVAARAELRALGLDDAKLARALRMIDLGDVLVDGDEVDGLEDAIEALKADVPELFVKVTRKRRRVAGDADREGKPAPKSRDASKIQADKLLGRA